MNTSGAASSPLLRAWELMPRGTPLALKDWSKRHATLHRLAVLHAPVLVVYGLAQGFSPLHVVLEALPIAAAAAAAGRTARSRRARETLTSLALVMSSAALVHLSGGLIEMHFHFFVVVALVTLYQQWLPFLLTVGFVLIHHGIAGAVAPEAVYNHPAAIADPWTWAVVHAGFIAMASAVGLANWKLNELARNRAQDYFRRLYEGELAVVQRLEEADRLKGELVAAVSHEFRTPLTVILGLAETMRRAEPDQRSWMVVDYAERILRNGRRLQQLIENLLEAEAPLERVRGACEVGLVVVTAVETQRDAAPEKDRFVVELEDGLQLPLTSTAAQLVLGNLLGNAVKHGYPATPIVVRARTSGDGVAVMVDNHGPPIPPARQSRIFEPFAQLDSTSTRTADGVGLGLHLVRRMVEGVGGRVDVTCIGGVTRFSLWFPAVAANLDALEA